MLGQVLLPCVFLLLVRWMCLSMTLIFFLIHAVFSTEQIPYCFWEDITNGHVFVRAAGLTGHVSNFGKNSLFTEC